VRVGAAGEDAVRDVFPSSFRQAVSAAGEADGEEAVVASEASAAVVVVAASEALVAVAVLGAAVAAPAGKKGQDRRMTKQALSRTR
jgi:hypothetical protein